MRGKKKIYKSGLSRRRVRMKKGDRVVVVSGANRGKGPGKVLSVDRKKGRIVVQGINLRTVHLKKSKEHPHGGTVKKEFPIDCSNVMLYSEKVEKGVRVRIEEKDGKRVRVGIPCGTVFE